MNENKLTLAELDAVLDAKYNAILKKIENGEKIEQAEVGFMYDYHTWESKKEIFAEDFREEGYKKGKEEGYKAAVKEMEKKAKEEAEKKAKEETEAYQRKMIQSMLEMGYTLEQIEAFGFERTFIQQVKEEWDKSK